MAEEMKVWILRPVTRWTPWYDKAFGFVVRAESEAEARQYANDKGGDELFYYPDVWLDPTLTTCEELTSKGSAGVVLRDFASA